MALAGVGTVEIHPDLTGFSRRLSSDMDRSFSSVSRSMGSRFRTFGASIVRGAGLTAAAISVPVVAGLSKAFGEASEAAKIGALTEAVIKSTGGAAQVSAEQVAGLAEALSNKAGVDDEVIQEGENLLLTFTKIRNETGKGNDIFNQATEAALNMSVALGTDMKGASIQVGKALNDPIKGVTALSRAGVSFTEEQKEQIKVLTETGDVLGAQKIVLSELETQFGGAAEAAALPMDKLKVRFGNLAETIGTRLMPVAEKVITWAGELLDTFDKKGIGGVLQMMGKRLKEAWPEIRAVLADMGKKLLDWLGDMAVKLGRQLLEWGRQLVEWIGPRIGPMLQELGRLVGRAGSWILDTGLPLLVRKLREWGAAFIRWVGPQIPPLLRELGRLLLRLGTWIVTDALPKIAGKLLEWGVAFARWVGTEAIPRLVTELGKLGGRIVHWAATDGLRMLAQAGLSLGISLVNGARSGLESLFNWFMELPSRIVGWGVALAGRIYDAARAIGTTIGNAITDGIKDALSSISFNVGGISGSIDLPGLFGFDTGGVVPGPMGRPTLAVVHGGETILPTHKPGFGDRMQGRQTTVMQVLLDRQVIAEAVHEPIRRIERSRR